MMSKWLRGSNRDPTKNLNDEIVLAYLRSRPQCVEKYIMEEVNLDILERWMIKRAQIADNVESPGLNYRPNVSRWKFLLQADKRAMLEDLMASVRFAPDEKQLASKVSRSIASAVGACHYNIYLYGSNGLALNGEDGSGDESDDLRTAKVVANTRQPIRVNAGDNQYCPDPDAAQALPHHALFQPLTRPDGKLFGVLQLFRGADGPPFYKEDEEIISNYLVWSGVVFLYSDLCTSYKLQKQQHEFLFQVVRSIFQDFVSTNVLVRKIIDFAQHLVQADRASLFLLDTERNELWAKVFEEEDESEEDESDGIPPLSEIRFPVGVGIAGYVAKTKQLVNIPDAYKDPRFNRAVDQRTGYKTKSILCMPIFKPCGDIIGVVQMVNKKTGVFTQEDEHNFEIFAIYCALALHHAELFEKLRESEQRHKVALEVLSYHSTCHENEMRQILPLSDEVMVLDRFDLNFLSTSDLDKVKKAIYMFNDLFGVGKFDLDCLIRFTLTVCKNYRRVPYHNWTHGFSVANTMYAIIKHSPGLFDERERLALYIGALCHDLDHRGRDNKFMVESGSPLALMYSTSTMEHHHFNQTVAILQQEGHNIFHSFDREEYKSMLKVIKHCILATDLTLFIKHKNRLNAILARDALSFSDPYHRSLVMAICMTGSDLAASAKPWVTQIETVRVIFQEFYQQGDEEKRAGRRPVPMMDRNKPEMQAISQVQFLSEICLPCYTLLASVIPGSRPLLIQCRKNLERWIEVSETVEPNQDVLGVAQP